MHMQLFGIDKYLAISQSPVASYLEIYPPLLPFVQMAEHSALLVVDSQIGAFAEGNVLYSALRVVKVSICKSKKLTGSNLRVLGNESKQPML